MHPELITLLRWDNLLTFSPTDPRVTRLTAEAWLAYANDPEFSQFFKKLRSHDNPCVPYLLYKMGKNLCLAGEVIENQAGLCKNWLGRNFTLTGFVGHLVDNVGVCASS